MFPFRRNGPKKRGKGGGANGGGGRRHHDNGGGAGRRVPGSAGELLSTMQSSTKALAQMLAGNTKMSGQLAHARGVLAQANRLVDERQPDRLPPAERERFFHCLALLKLTVTDAEEAATAEELAPEPTARPAVPLDAERLRDVARRLASPDPVPQAPVAASPPPDEDLDDLPGPGNVTSGYALSPARQAAEEQSAGDVTGTGPRRERLRLKPVQRGVPGAEP